MNHLISTGYSCSTVSEKQCSKNMVYVDRLNTSAIDTPLSVDPFTFKSTCEEDSKASLKSSVPTTAPSTVVNGGFVVPSLPDHVALASNSPNSAIEPAGIVKKPAVPLKNPFPDAHLPFLLNKISELKMPRFILLVEAIYQELKVHKVKKIAIEAKSREVGEKCKEKEVWVVKPTGSLLCF